jgi:hypothetical protein
VGLAKASATGFFFLVVENMPKRPMPHPGVLAAAALALELSVTEGVCGGDLSGACASYGEGVCVNGILDLEQGVSRSLKD